MNHLHQMKHKNKRAGGLVFNKKAQILLIFRKGSWDLPKGKVEKNETLASAAIRETAEETGLKKNQLILENSLLTTAHSLKGKKIKTKWYLLQYYGEKKKMIPQIEEGISKCKWVDMASIESYRPKLRNYAKDVFEFLIIEKIKASSGKRIIS